MAIFRRIAIVLFCTLIWPSAYPQSRGECSTVPSAILHRPVRYCILLPLTYDAQKKQHYPVLYFLHGLGQDERSLVSSGIWNIADDERRAGKIGEFLVATPEGDAGFYINSFDGKVRYEDFFIHEFIPKIEHKYRVNSAHGGRAIGGVSMGGYGALRFAFKYPEMFSAVAVQMPALYETLPPGFSAAVTANGGRGMPGAAFGSPPDEGYWKRESPLTLAHERMGQLRGLRIYFDCGDRDGFGFDAGARSLDRILTGGGIAHEFHIYPGGHDASYVAAHFAEVLEFEWDALKPATETQSRGGKQ
jgi:S-formylglutathione hydrolase FrmB